MIIFLRASILSIIIEYCCSNSFNSTSSLLFSRFFSLFIKESGDVILVRNNHGIVQRIPDTFTAQLLGHSESTPNISNDLVRLFRKGTDLPSLVPANDTPDEKLRIIIEKVVAICPSSLFVVESHFLQGNVICSIKITLKLFYLAALRRSFTERRGLQSLLYQMASPIIF